MTLHECQPAQVAAAEAGKEEKEVEEEQEVKWFGFPHFGACSKREQPLSTWGRERRTAGRSDKATLGQQLEGYAGAGQVAADKNWPQGQGHQPVGCWTGWHAGALKARVTGLSVECRGVDTGCPRSSHRQLGREGMK